MDPETKQPTQMQLRGLRAIAAAECGRLHIADFRRALAAKGKGFHLVFHRMEANGWIERQPYGGDTHLALTDEGLAAIAKAGA